MSAPLILKWLFCRYLGPWVGYGSGVSPFA